MATHSVKRWLVFAGLLLVAAASYAQDGEAQSLVVPPSERILNIKDYPFVVVAEDTPDSDTRALLQVEPRTSQFLVPSEGATVNGNGQQIIIVSFPIEYDATEPVGVSFETNLGELTNSDKNLGSDGSAIVYIKSTTPGPAKITATTDTGDSIELNITFANIDESRSEFKIGEQTVPLDAFADRIGIQATTKATRGEIAVLANELGLEVTRVFYRGMYEFKLDEAYTLNSIDILGDLIESNHNEIVKNSGIIVEVVGDSIPLIATNFVIVVFHEVPSEEELDDFIDRFSLAHAATTSETYDAYSIDGCGTIFIIPLQSLDERTSLQVAMAILADGDDVAAFAQSNFVEPMTPNDDNSSAGIPTGQDIPNLDEVDLLNDFCPALTGIDPHVCAQWHHDNDGAGDATEDADIDTVEAWRLSDGSATNPLIAVIDSGFSTTHPDYKDNLWAENGVIGWDFADDLPASLIDNENNPNSHGTSVAGIIGSERGNTKGGSGVCPGCELMLLRHDNDNESTTRAMCFAKFKGAVAINNSWGPPYAFTTTQVAIQYATDADISVVFAMETDQAIDNSNDPFPIDFAVLPNVIGVSRSTNQDIRTPSGYGTAMDVLGPSRQVVHFGISTTRVYQDGGLKNGYTKDFGGTSAAAPMVTGTIGLMLDVDPDLSRIELQRILQDTADRVDPDCAAYDASSGFSNPETAMYLGCGDYVGQSDMSFGAAPTHGYGRINAFEAVSLVAPFDPDETDPGLRGHAGKDLLLRDNYLDWGNTEQTSSTMFALPRRAISVKKSVDIKIDAEDYDGVDLTPGGFAAFQTEHYKSGERAQVYVRLRNRGPETIDNAVLKLYWTLAPNSPPLSATFWSDFPNDPTTTPNPDSWNALDSIGLKDVEYSGASVAGCPDRDVPDCHPLTSLPDDNAHVVMFQLPALELTGAQRLSLLAIAHSNEDPVAAKVVASNTFDFTNVLAVVENDNNVALWVTHASCPPWLVKLIVILIIVAIILVIIIVFRWSRGLPVLTIVYIVMVTTALVLVYVYIKHPACLTVAVEVLKINWLPGQ